MSRECLSHYNHSLLFFIHVSLYTIQRLCEAQLCFLYSHSLWIKMSIIYTCLKFRAKPISILQMYLPAQSNIFIKTVFPRNDNISARRCNVYSLIWIFARNLCCGTLYMFRIYALHWSFCCEEENYCNNLSVDIYTPKLCDIYRQLWLGGREFREYACLSYDLQKI